MSKRRTREPESHGHHHFPDNNPGLGTYDTDSDSDSDYVGGGLMDTDVDERSKLLEDPSNSGTGFPVPGLSPHNNAVKTRETSYEDALLSCGFGRFHVVILLLCGWAVSSDAIEVLSISFVLPAATCDLGLSSSDKGVINAMVFLGMLVGGYVWGSLADRWGRRSILIWSLLVNAVGNLASSTVQSYHWFVVCRFLSGIGVGGSMPVVFTYFTEFQHKKRRGSMISLLATFWMGGNVIAAGLAWIIIPREYLSFTSSDFTYHSWRVFVALCSVPALTSAAMFVLMPESPKFLLQSGRPLDAIHVLQRVHAANRPHNALEIETLVLSHDERQDVEGSSPLVETQVSGSGCCSRLARTMLRLLHSTIALFKPDLRRRTLLLLVINFTLAFAYYGLFMWFPELFQRIENYGGSFCDLGKANATSPDVPKCETPSNEVFVESFLTSISNLPGNILTFCLVDRVGRKPLLVSSMTLSGVSVFGLYFIRERWQNVLMSCLFGAISVIGFNIIDCLLVELFPTQFRSTAFGVQTMATRVGAILGNVMFGILIDVHCAIPMLMVASLLTLGGVMSLWLPKTTAIDIH